MKTSQFLTIAFAFVVLFSCEYQEVDYSFKTRQSEAIMGYRQQGYFEYASRLNDSMWQVLENFDKTILNEKTLYIIKDLNLKIKSEKHALGCYVIPWKHHERISDQNDVIMLEWNASLGVIIRVFTKSERIKRTLPSHSF